MAASAVSYNCCVFGTELDAANSTDAAYGSTVFRCTAADSSTEAGDNGCRRIEHCPPLQISSQLIPVLSTHAAQRTDLTKYKYPRPSGVNEMRDAWVAVSRIEYTKRAIHRHIEGDRCGKGRPTESTPAAGSGDIIEKMAAAVSLPQPKAEPPSRSRGSRGISAVGSRSRKKKLVRRSFGKISGTANNKANLVHRRCDQVLPTASEGSSQVEKRFLLRRPV